MSGLFGILLVLLIAATSIAIVVSRDWRWLIAGLGLQYLWAFLLIISSWPLELAAVKIVTGWMAASILGLSRLSLAVEQPEMGPRLPTSAAFQTLAAGLVILVVMGSAPRLADWATAISLNQAWGGLILIGMGMLQLGLRASPFRTMLGLLTLFSGFEILYAAVEASTLVAGLLALLNLGIALVGSYLLIGPGIEARE